MAYLKKIDEKFVNDVINRQEFLRNKSYKKEITLLDQEIIASRKLILRSYQRFAEVYISPNSPSKKVYIKYGTGVGKTNLALNVAINFVNLFQKNREIDPLIKIPSIGIIGFTKNIFRRELLKWPEFGYVTREEIDQQKNLAFLADTGSKQDVDNYIEYITYLRRRLTNKKKKGFFVFYGYREFSNRVINPVITNYDSDDEIINKMSRSIRKAIKSRSNYKNYINMFSRGDADADVDHDITADADEDDEDDADEDDKFQNFEKKIFKNDISNMTEAEIYKGIEEGTIKVNEELLESFRHGLIICDEIHNVYNSNDKNNWGIALQLLVNYLKDDVHILFLSATPINHSPTEIVDLANLLTDGKFTKKDFNMDQDNFNNLTEMQQNTIITKIGKVFVGKVLFLEDADPKYYPRSELQGDSIPGIDILKFIRCGMPELGLKTYLSFYEGTLSQDSQYIMDFILPNPSEVSDLGLYKTQEVKNAYLEASPDWLQKNNIVINTEFGFNISGEFLTQSNLKNVSTKYYKMLSDIKSHIKNGGGKILIYHKYVRMSGVLFIKEVLLHNGFIDEYSSPAENTLDAMTGLPKKEYEQSEMRKCRNFSPCRFVIIHSDIDQNIRDKSIEKFNSPSNAQGDQVKILIGADIIKESFDLKCINLVMIMSKPDNISTLLQIFGRAKRQNSHIDLPINYRYVNYRIYVASLPNTKKLSYEEEKYKERINDYKLIQKIEKTLNENAVDSSINFGMIKTTFVKKNELGVLEFNPKFNAKGEINKWTNLAYYNENEIVDTIYIIKRLFIEVSPVLKITDLFTLVRNPPFSLEFNPNMIEEDNINIALFRLVSNLYDHVVSLNNKHPIDKLFDPNDKIIIINGSEYCITKINEFFILAPFSQHINVFTESIYRSVNHNKKTIININDFLSNSNNSENYEIRRDKFINKYSNIIKHSPDKIIDAICDYSTEFQETLIEEMIETIFESIINPKSRVTNNNRDDYYKKLDFYCEMIQYYSVHEIIIFFNGSQQYIQDTYDLKCESCEKKNAVLKSMEQSISKLNCKWCPKLVQDTVTSNIIKLKRLIRDPKPKIDGDILPIGYFMQRVPKFYHPIKGWYDAAEYSQNCRTFKENEIIIGYYQKSPTGLRVKFKIRRPIHKQIIDIDTRKSEKGIICSSKSKTELLEILDQLGIKINTDESILNLCETLRYRLLYLEIIERRNPQSNIKYFYHYWECQPFSKQEIL